MRVLVGCEESQEVTKAFRALGHEAFSCDLQDCSGGFPEWHLKMSVFEAIDLGGWDLGIFFPPCTHIAQAGGAWFERKRKDGRQKEALIFFTKIANCNIKRKVIENPNGIFQSPTYIPKWFPELLPEMAKCGLPRKPDQIIQPYYFGDPKRKTTGLWLWNLPKLEYTLSDSLFSKATAVKVQDLYRKVTIRGGTSRPGSKRYSTWLDVSSPKKKSKTFPSIAKAMAEQWGNINEIKIAV